MRYTAKQVKAMIARGEDRTSWTKAEEVTGLFLEASIRADVDEAGIEPNWKRIVKGIPPRKDTRKLKEYCLNPQHPRGRHKARVFVSVRIRRADAEELRSALLAAARSGGQDDRGESVRRAIHD